MHQRVRRDQVELGMFIHAFEGGWLNHPFWRSRFLLTDPRDLHTLRSSAVEGVIIDISKGRAPAAAGAARQASAEAPATCSAAEEFGRAVEIVGRTKQAMTEVFGEARLGNAIDAARLSPLVENVTASIARNRAALLGVTRLRSKDEYTYMHSVSVCALMINLAQHLGLGEDAVRDAGMAGLLHDIGKMSVPAELLNKPGKLSEGELSTVKTHPERGHALLRSSGGVVQPALEACLHHHERVDGGGYPFGLRGEQIGLIARMAAVCDVYDAITSARAYKEPWSPADAMSSMVAWKGHFDEAVLAAFIKSVGIYPVGTLVRLRSGRLAVVIGENGEDPARPPLRAFYSALDRRPIAPTDLYPSRSVHGDRIVAQENPAQWGFADWPSRCAKLLSGAA